MRTLTIPLPMLMFVVATRAALGVGVGLLLAERMPSERRRALGLTLLGLGAVTTVPAVRFLSGRLRSAPADVGR